MKGDLHLVLWNTSELLVLCVTLVFHVKSCWSVNAAQFRMPKKRLQLACVSGLGQINAVLPSSHGASCALLYSTAVQQTS